jgi:hypothetical protein
MAEKPCSAIVPNAMPVGIRSTNCVSIECLGDHRHGTPALDRGWAASTTGLSARSGKAAILADRYETRHLLTVGAVRSMGQKKEQAMAVSGFDRRDFFGGAGLVALTALGAPLANAQSLSPGDDALNHAMEHLADVIRRFPAEFASLEAPATQIDRAEGYRLFLRYLTIGIDQYIQFADPAFPAFHQKTRDGVRKFAGDSPEQLYDVAVISGDYDYEVSGNMRETALVEFTVYSGKLNNASGARRLISSLTDERLAVDGKGDFVVRLNRRGDGSNALRLDADASSLVVRRYLRDPWKDRPRPLEIRRTSGNPVLPSLAPDPLAMAIEAAADFALWNVKTWAHWVARDRTTKLNVLTHFDDTGDIYTPAGHRYLAGYWQVPAGKALLIEFAPPKGAHWSFVPMNYWMESFEWRFGNRVFASSFQTSPTKDGYVRLALSGTDPRLPDVQWLETLGHNEGAMALRLARYSGPMPDVRCMLVSTGQA